jgi:hypothetical protein
MRFAQDQGSAEPPIGHIFRPQNPCELPPGGGQERYPDPSSNVAEQ